MARVHVHGDPHEQARRARAKGLQVVSVWTELDSGTFGTKKEPTRQLLIEVRAANARAAEAKIVQALELDTHDFAVHAGPSV
jgi:hypothetical protein